MKSAYGRQSPAPDYERTCVEPGSPMGELMRRYWQPVCTSEELRDLPRKEKLLCGIKTRNPPKAGEETGKRSRSKCRRDAGRREGPLARQQRRGAQRVAQRLADRYDEN